MNNANLEKLPQAEGADYFIVLDPKEGIVHHTYTADLGRSFGHDHIKDAQLDGVASAARWVVRPLFTAEPDLLTDRDEAEEFADKILDLVLGTDRHEWTSRYGRADALLEVEDKMATAAAPQHSDDVAVDRLAVAMKAKLAKQRDKGYGGWDDSEYTREWLSQLLREHVDKGDPVDVANFCAFLSARGEGIATKVWADAGDDSALLDAMEQKRIAVVPEYEGPWDAEVYNDDGNPSHRGTGATPREAIRAAIAAAKGK